MEKVDFSKVAIMYDVIGACLEVRKILGIGLLEKSYKLALIRELELRGHSVQYEKGIGIEYKGCTIKDAFFADVIVDGELIVELKAVSELMDVHHAQLRNYMALSGIPYGLLVNFHAPYLMDGISRKALAEFRKI